MDSREEIKARLSIYDLVSKYVTLKKAGRNFKGLCPFHNEKTPSFVVSPEKEMAFCFGCQKGGDIFAFYQLVEACDFGESMKALAEMTGVKLESSLKSKEEYEKIKSKKVVLKDIHKVVSDFYVDSLWNSKKGQKVLEYVKKRGLKDETIKLFNLGFAPDSFDETYRFLLGKGFTKEDIVAAGLASSKDAGMDQIFDRFRLRLMFPIFDDRGDVVAFGGRALKADEPAKYLNSPETDIYHKSNILYGFYQAKERIRQEKKVIIVEGYFDQILTYQAGFQNVVASSGTALTAKHVHKLSRFVDVFLACFDTDKAGQEALLRAAELIFLAEKQLRVVNLGEYKDPGEALEKPGSEKSFAGYLEKAKEFFDYILEMQFDKAPQSERFGVQNINAFLQKILPILRKISSSVVKDIVLRKLAMRMQLKVEHLYDELKKDASPVKESKQEVAANTMQVNTEEYLWALALLYPEAFWNVRKEYSLAEKMFIFKEKQVYKYMEDYYNGAGNFTDFQFRDLPAELFEKFDLLTLYLESLDLEDWTPAQVEMEFLKLLNRLLNIYKKEKAGQLQIEIKQKEEAGEKEGLAELFNELQKILALK